MLLVSISFSALIVHGQYLPVFGLVFGVLVAVIFLRWPPFGLASLILASFTVPLGIRTGSETDINITILIIAFLFGLWFMDRLTSKTYSRPTSSRVFIPLILFGVVSILAFISGQISWFSFGHTAPLFSQLGGLAVFLLSIIVFFLAADQVKDIRWLQRLTWLFVGLGAIYIIGRAIPSLGQYFLPIYQEGATGSLLWVWLVALSFSMAFINRKLRRAVRIAAFILVLLSLYIALHTALVWASGWIPPIVAILAILWFDNPRFALLGTLITGVIIYLNYQTVFDLIMINEQYSYITRVEAWRIVLDNAMVNPILGLGPANYYWSTEITPIFGWFVRFSSHNQYIDIFAQTGLLGLGCFIWFVWEVGKLCLHLRDRVSSGFLRAYVYAVFGGLAGTLVAGLLGDWFLPFVYNIGLDGMRSSIFPWLFMGGVVAIMRFYDHTSDVKVTEKVTQ